MNEQCHASKGAINITNKVSQKLYCFTLLSFLTHKLPEKSLDHFCLSFEAAKEPIKLYIWHYWYFTRWWGTASKVQTLYHKNSQKNGKQLEVDVIGWEAQPQDNWQADNYSNYKLVPTPIFWNMGCKAAQVSYYTRTLCVAITQKQKL